MGWIMKAHREYYKRLDPLSFYTDRKFQQRYRLTKQTVRILVDRFVATRRVRSPRGKHAIPHRLKMCVALRYFATGCDMRTIGDVHGISKTSVSRAVEVISEYFRDHLTEYVEWPDSVEAKNAKATPFYRKTRKPRCFGAVDGTHISIACPRGVTNDENQYYCYKGYYSINAMIICDFNGYIMHVNACNPGSCNDVYIMNGSQISYLGDRNDFKGYYLLGDSGYMLSDYILTPVREELTQADVNYNKWHRKTRSLVERCIGVLKQRWRCLDSSGGYLFNPPRRAAAIIESCVCLHNCAKAGKTKLLKDVPAKDSFVRLQSPIEQPNSPGRVPKIVFHNRRKTFINTYFQTSDEETK